MPDPIITNNKNFGVAVWEPIYENAVLVDAGGATYAAGTVLGRITEPSGRMSAYASGNTDGTEIPKAILTQEVVLAASVNTPCRVLVGGRVRANEIFAHAAPTTALTPAERDQLRDFTIVPQDSVALMELDNQP